MRAKTRSQSAGQKVPHFYDFAISDQFHHKSLKIGSPIIFFVDLCSLVVVQNNLQVMFQAYRHVNCWGV